MKLQKKMMFVVLLLIALQQPAFAQVDRVAMRTARLGCGLCAMFSEIYLKQLGTIDKIQISKSQEAVMITYKVGASFQPSELRNALKKTEVGVTQIQISARGRVQEQGGKQLFLAGKKTDSFLWLAPNLRRFQPVLPFQLKGSLTMPPIPWSSRFSPSKQLRSSLEFPPF